MKVPRIVQSYWSKAYQNTPNSGWAFRESHYMSWALSCLQLKQFYDEIELVTDSEGADLLINKLHLPYTSCLTILDKLKNENPAIWALGKIAAYEVQQEPFIHVDGQNIEKNYSMGINLLDEMRDKNFTFPFHLSLVDIFASFFIINPKLGAKVRFFCEEQSLLFVQPSNQSPQTASDRAVYLAKNS